MLERIPVGDNYEKNRNSKARDFSFLKRPKINREVIVYVDVALGGGKNGRIAIHEGDEPKVLAKNFAKTFDLGMDMQLGLEELLKEQLHNALEG